MSHRILFRLSFVALQFNLDMLRIHETLNVSRLKFQLLNPLLEQERIIVPFRANSVAPLPNNFSQHIIPDK